MQGILLFSRSRRDYMQVTPACTLSLLPYRGKTILYFQEKTLPCRRVAPTEQAYYSSELLPITDLLVLRTWFSKDPLVLSQIFSLKNEWRII
jgi:hypothetical protein